MSAHRSLFDFFGDQDREGLFYAPRVYDDNIPYRGPAAPAAKPEQLEQLPIRALANVRTFDTSDPQDLADYRLVLQRAANGRSQVSVALRNWDADAKKMLVYCEWYDLERDGTGLPTAEPGTMR